MYQTFGVMSSYSDKVGQKHQSKVTKIEAQNRTEECQGISGALKNSGDLRDSSIGAYPRSSGGPKTKKYGAQTCILKSQTFYIYFEEIHIQDSKIQSYTYMYGDLSGCFGFLKVYDENKKKSSQKQHILKQHNFKEELTSPINEPDASASSRPGRFFINLQF